ncbi:MAG: helix-hairpin-helix domain-containing protein [Candidatus Thiothrix sulfatifontis]|nr:MAG: helix-hairpin-helix domain-containing protein [Candidatus Thiothrix sulfatifontis]
MTKLPKLGLIYLQHVWRFFDQSNFKGWPEPIDIVTYHWDSPKEDFIQQVRAQGIDVLIGNIPATAYETFCAIEAALPEVRFVPSLKSQFANKSKENVTLFCHQHDLPVPHTEIFYDEAQGYAYLADCVYPKIIKRSYGASNYGGYFVHKVDSAAEAIALFRSKRYLPMYIQDCIPLTADIRVMLIGHQPVCAFWRVAGEGQWITNTSQGGHMSYSGVPQVALDLAVAASRAAEAEYWACDIAESNGEYFILECATAFAAFPYIRDWIGQYLMWDFCPERFAQPVIPLYHWEALGKVDARILRRLRHLEFGDSDNPSADGEMWEREGYEQYALPMERTGTLQTVPNATYSQQPLRLTTTNDLPSSVAVVELSRANAAVVAEVATSIPAFLGESYLDTGMGECSAEEGIYTPRPVSTVTPLPRTLPPLENAPAAPVFEEITVVIPLAAPSAAVLDEIPEEMPEEISEPALEEVPDEVLDQVPEQPEIPPSDDSAVNINLATLEELQTIDNLGEKRARKIIADRQVHGLFSSCDDLLRVPGIGQKLLNKLSPYLKT